MKGRNILLEIIVVRHLLFDPIRLEAVEQQSGREIVTLVDVVLQSAVLLALLVTSMAVVALVLVGRSVGVGRPGLPVFYDGEKSWPGFDWIRTGFIL